MTSPLNQRPGIVLFAHGSRDPLWHAPLQAVLRQVQALNPNIAAVCAYLELSTPDLPQAVESLMMRGVDTIAVIPVFLGVGKHAREDLPRLVEDLRGAYPQVQFDLRPAVGEDPRLIRVLADIALSAVDR